VKVRRVTVIFAAYPIFAHVEDHDVDRDYMHFTSSLLCISCEVHMHAGCPRNKPARVGRDRRNAESFIERTPYSTLYRH
jgi:hypothetical protein